MFKKVLFLAAVLVGSCWTIDSVSAEDTYVRSYYRSSGTYVRSHYRSAPDGNFYNNYSTYPNVNPYTGTIGSHRTPTYSFPSYKSSSSRSYGSSNYGLSSPFTPGYRLSSPFSRGSGLSGW